MFIGVLFISLPNNICVLCSIPGCLILNVTYSNTVKVRYQDLLSNIKSSSWKGCLRECAQRYTVCKAVSFHRGTTLCQLGLSTIRIPTNDHAHMSVDVNNTDISVGDCFTICYDNSL